MKIEVKGAGNGHYNKSEMAKTAFNNRMIHIDTSKTAMEGIMGRLVGQLIDEAIEKSDGPFIELYKQLQQGLADGSIDLRITLKDNGDDQTGEA